MTEKQLHKLQAEGKIQGWAQKAGNVAQMSPQAPSAGKGSEAKTWVHEYLYDMCRANGWHLWLEHYPVPGRRFRADWAIKEIDCLVEYEGLNSAKSRHTTLTGYTNDATKYNLAQAEGWRVIRVTALNYKQLPFFIDKILSK